MTQVWPGFGEAPVPTVVSIICKPEAVVMGFPAVWAAAMVGTKANGAATIIIAIAASIGIFACLKRILGTFRLRIGSVSSATGAALKARRRIAVIPGWSEGPDLRCAIAHR